MSGKVLDTPLDVWQVADDGGKIPLGVWQVAGEGGTSQDEQEDTEGRMLVETGSEDRSPLEAGG